MSDIDKRLDEILDPPAYGFSAEFLCYECMFDFKEAKQAIKQLIEEEVYTALVKELSQMLDAQIVKPEYHNLVVGKTVGYQAKSKTV